MTLIVPEFFGNEKSCPYWGETFLFDANAFCGATSVLLASMALLNWRNRDVRFWAAVTAAILGFSLGKYSWFYDLCYLLVPWVDRFRGIGRLSIFVVFGMSVLAGIGLDEVLSGKYAARQRRLCLAVGVASAAALAAALVELSGRAPPAWESFFDWVRGPGSELYYGVPHALKPEFLQKSFVVMLKSVSFSAGILLAGSMLIGSRGRWLPVRPRRGLGLTILVAAELCNFEAKYVVLMDTEPWRTIALQVRSVLADDHDLYRIAAYSQDPPLVPNRFLYGRLQSAGGHENFVLYRYSRFLFLWAGIEPQWQTFLTVPNEGRIYDVLNVKYYASPPEIPVHEPGDELIAEHVFRFGGRDFDLYRNGNALPRVSLVHAAHRADDIDSAVESLRSLYDGRFETEAVIEGDPGIALKPVSDRDRLEERVAVTEYTPNRIVVEAHCSAPGLLLYSENYYPGWVAFVDGAEVPVLPANVFMRGVPVTAGDHRVEMTYRPAPFRRGCMFMAGSLFVLISIWTRSLFWNLRRLRLR